MSFSMPPTDTKDNITNKSAIFDQLEYRDGLIFELVVHSKSIILQE